MQLKGAMTVLKKDAEFLGLTFEELCIFIERIAEYSFTPRH